MDSSVRVPGAGQPLQTPEGTAVVQVKEGAEGLKPVTSVVAQARKVAEGLKPATSVVGGAVRVLLVDLARAEANGHRAIAARRAAALLPGAVGHPAAVVGPPAAVAVAEVAVVVAEGEDVGEQEIEKNKY